MTRLIRGSKSVVSLGLAGGLLWMLPCLAAEHHGQVTFGGLPVPGVTVTAAQGDRKFTAITDQQGVYTFPELPDGNAATGWTVRIEMLGFAPVQREIAVGPDAPSTTWELKMLALGDIHTEAVASAPPPLPTTTPAVAPPATASKGRGKKSTPPAVAANTPGAFQRADVNASTAVPAGASTNNSQSSASSNTAASPNPTLNGDLAQRAADGFLVNGSTVNGASSPFALNPAFGNNRRGAASLYNGNIGLTFDNSVFDARSFSLTGQDTAKPSYSRFQGMASFGGPFRIPHLVRNGPMFTLSYQWVRNRNASTTPGLMPTAAERDGDFSQALNTLGQPVQLYDPKTGLPFPGNVIPASRISPQALSLLNLYPLPNFTGSGSYNYQIPLVGATHQDSLQSRLNKQLGRKDQLNGMFAFQSMRSDNPNLFGFLDTSDTLGINSNLNWRHTFTPRFYGTLGFQFSRFSLRTTPFFDQRENIAGNAGIAGNNQDPVNWGPPTLAFSSGIASLTDAQAASDHNQTSAVSYSILWIRSRHNLTFGGDFRRQQFNYLSQQDPRGTFNFTGAATQAISNGAPVVGTGSDFADFLLGVPDTSSIAFGNADKYFRESAYDGYFTDDWRVSSGLTINAGIRWEYAAPITELYGRLVNLDVAPGFSAVAPVVANDPIGSITGRRYPDSLMQPDKSAFEPRVGLSWRPFPASSMIIRAGYGIYYNTSVYQSIAAQMAQQPPLSKSLSVQNSASDPLTLANGFNASPSITPNTFAIDPNFRIGYAHNWQASVQRDLPWSLQMTATYLGIKGTRGVQEFLPNTYPEGAVNPCPTCPSGFVYMTSNGNSTREAAQLQLRRRLRNGFTATLQYTFSKSIDDVAALGGQGAYMPTQTQSSQSTVAAQPTAFSPASALTAQNWLDLSGERGLSNFDQRHLLSVQAQYTTGMGVRGGTLLSGWKGALFKEWTIATQITAGTGLPLTPTYFAAVSGTGVTGTIRPEYTGAPVYADAHGLFLNPAAYIAPAPGEWGNAGRNSITGPAQFSLNGSFGRTFRLSDRLSGDLRIDATNALNHVTFTNWNTIVNSAQFGLPNATSANPMRSLQTTFRVRF